MSSLSFSKQHKLLKRPDFLRCYSGGKRHFTSGFIFFVLPTGSELWRFGVAVSKKVGGAVQRNRVKRLLRECIRLNQSKIPAGIDFVAVPKKSLNLQTLNYASLEKDLLPLLTGLPRHYGPEKARPNKV